MIVPPGPSVITFQGRRMQREQGFVDVPDITCPDGHRVKLGAVTIRSDSGLACINKAVAGGGECGALMWLLYLPAAGHLKRFYVADVEYRELLLWEERHFGTEDVFRYLGVWFTRGDARALRRSAR